MKTGAVVILITLGLVGCSTELDAAESPQKQHLAEQTETSYAKVKPNVPDAFQYQKAMTHMRAWGAPEHAASVEKPPCNKCWCPVMFGTKHRVCCTDPSVYAPCPDNAPCSD